MAPAAVLTRLRTVLHQGIKQRHAVPTSCRFCPPRDSFCTNFLPVFGSALCFVRSENALACSPPNLPRAAACQRGQCAAPNASTLCCDPYTRGQVVYITPAHHGAYNSTPFSL